MHGAGEAVEVFVKLQLEGLSRCRFAWFAGMYLQRKDLIMAGWGELAGARNRAREGQALEAVNQGSRVGQELAIVGVAGVTYLRRAAVLVCARYKHYDGAGVGLE